MAEHNTWVRSLYNPKLKPNNDPCTWSKELQIIIHRFNLGERTCSCGEETVVEKETYGGWRRLTNGKQSPKNCKGKSSSHTKGEYARSK